MTSLPLTFFSLHPTRDVVVSLPRVALGDVQRADAWISYPGGKALNGARTAGLLGGSPRAIVVAPTVWRTWLRGILAAHGVRWRMLPVVGEGRVCVILNERRRETVINTNLTMEFTPRLYAAVAKFVRQTAARPGFLVFAGSLPPSLGPAKIRTLLALATGGPARLVLDQTGRWLRAGVRFRPWLIKPNLREFHQLIGRTTSSLAQAMAAADGVRAGGVGRVLLSLGDEGCVLVSPAGRWKAAAVRLPAGTVMSPVGCGDALLGAFLRTVAAGAAEPEALAWGVAAATANLAHPGAVQFAADEVRKFVPQVRVTRA
jgi:1-phosphofructokinase family hexose kinase